MPVMAKKTKKSVDKSDGHKSAQIPFRPDNPALVDALDAYAEHIRNSRNMAIVFLLEEALGKHGFWPWPRPSAEK
jgi:hypothetical protein